MLWARSCSSGSHPPSPDGRGSDIGQERFTPELAEKILEAKAGDYVQTLAYEWDESDEGPREVSPG